MQASVWKEQTISKDLAAISYPSLDLPDVDELMEDSSESNSELNTDIQVAKETLTDTTNQVANISSPEHKQEPVKKEEPTYSPSMLAEQAAKDFATTEDEALKVLLEQAIEEYFDYCDDYNH